MAAPTKSPSGGDKDRLLYEVVRDELIEAIKDGNYPAGALLPSVRELTVQWTVSTTTARKVLGELVKAGYARAEGPKGHISTGAVPVAPETETIPAGSAVTRRLTVRPRLSVPLDSDRGEAESDEIDVRVESAPAEVALALRFEDPSTPVSVRRRVIKDDHGTPVLLRISFTRREIVNGTRLADPEPVRQGWPQAFVDLADVEAWQGDAFVTARHPTDVEAAALGLAPTACVLVLVELLTAEADTIGGEPFDYTINVWPGESTQLAIR